MSEPRSLRVAFLGNAAWSVPSLEAVAGSRHRVALVVTGMPRPGRRGTATAPTPVAQAADRSDLVLEEVATLRDPSAIDRVAATDPDVLAVVAYGEILPDRILRIPRLAPVNVHFSLLPRLRGASPVQTALLLGLQRTGVTTIVMEAGVDTGPILRQAEEEIRAGDDAGSLGGRLAELGGRLLVETLDALADGTADPHPQDGSRATYARKLGPQDRRLDWTEPARTLANVVRALSPDPAAAAEFRGAALRIFRAVPAEGTGSPGVILEVDKEGFAVGTGDGVLRPLELAPAGHKRMGAGAFVNGFGPRAGERLT